MSLNEARKQCGLADGNGYHDHDLTDLIAAARQRLEQDTGIVCYTGSYTWKLTQWPDEEWIEIRCLRPVTSITLIAYLDGNGTNQPWSTSNYTLEPSTLAPIVRLTYASTWPTIRGDMNGITITLVAGYANVLAIPPQVKTAVKLVLSMLWSQKMGEAVESMKLEECYANWIAASGLMRSTYP